MKDSEEYTDDDFVKDFMRNITELKVDFFNLDDFTANLIADENIEGIEDVDVFNEIKWEGRHTNIRYFPCLMSSFEFKFKNKEEFLITAEFDSDFNLITQRHLCFQIDECVHDSDFAAFIQDEIKNKKKIEKNWDYDEDDVALLIYNEIEYLAAEKCDINVERIDVVDEKSAFLHKNKSVIEMIE